MAGESPPTIELHEEIENDYDVSGGILFCRVGESVPLLHGDPPFYDPALAPLRPIVVSEHHGLLFLAHSEGFFVSRTEEVIRLAKVISEKGKGPCVKDHCVADVKIGRVCLLAISGDSSTLAAVIGSDIHFFAIDSFTKQEWLRTSCSIHDSGIVKDFKWKKNKERSFIILSSCGRLYRGNLDNPLKDVIDDVDAVDWCTNGDLFVCARNNFLSIMASNLKEVLRMSLLIESWSRDPNLELSMKVDTIEWIRDDCIVIGCVRIREDGTEDDYLVQLITKEKDGFTEDSTNPVVFSFPSLFEEISKYAPSGSGPNLLINNLDHWGVILTSFRKSISSHLMLISWVLNEDTREAALLEYENELYTPRVDLQENGDDNLILGFGVDKVSLKEKLSVKVGVEVKEVITNCILLCMTYEGKVIIFNLARLSDPIDLGLPAVALNIEAVSEVGEETPSEEQVADTVSRVEDKAQGREIEDVDNLEATKGESVRNITTEKVQGYSSRPSSGEAVNFDKVALSSSQKSETIVPSTNNSLDGFDAVSSSSTMLKMNNIFKENILGETSATKQLGMNVSLACSFSSTSRGQSLDSAVVHGTNVVPAIKSQGNDMVKELDSMLFSIERKGGIRDACTVSIESSVLALEEGLNDLSETTKECLGRTAEQLLEIHKVQNVRQMVLASQVFMEEILKQASNNVYWDIWNQQKLSPELELKKVSILKKSESLMNQFLELERHFHTLEIGKFGEKKSKFQESSRRQFQSFQSMLNTVNSQLVAAEQFSESLSKQMAMLNINYPSARHSDVSKELFEFIGIPHELGKFHSPGDNRNMRTPESLKRILVTSASNCRNLTSSSAKKVMEPVSVRRMRNSLDRSLMNFEPQKTTVKRIHQEEHSEASVHKHFDMSVRPFDSRTRPLGSQSVISGKISFSSCQSSAEKFLFQGHPATNDVNRKSPSSVIGYESPDSNFPALSSLSSKSTNKTATTYGLRDLSGTSKIQSGGHSETSIFKLLPTSEAQSVELGSSPHAKNSVKSFKSLSTTKNTSPELLNGKRNTSGKSSLRNESGVPYMSSTSMALPLETFSPSSVKNYISSSSSLSSASFVDTRAPETNTAAIKSSTVPSETASPSNLTETKGSGSMFGSGFLQISSMPASGELISASGELIFDVKTSDAHQSASVSSSMPASSTLNPSSSSTSPSVQFLKSSTVPSETTSPSNLTETKGSGSIFGSGFLQTSASSFTDKMPDVSSRSPPISGALGGIPSMNGPGFSVPSSEGIISLSSSKLKISIASHSNSSLKEKDETANLTSVQEDEMEEEAPDVTNAFSMDALDSFGIGTSPSNISPKPNPFGTSFNTSMVNPLLPLTTPPGGGFRPASFSIPSSTLQSSPPLNSGGFSGFGQPAQVGAGQPAQTGLGQQALGSVLGAFGQSRQLGTGMPGFTFSPSGFVDGALSPAASTSSSSAAPGLGFSAMSSGSVGFAGAASRGGFAAMASSSTGGFAGAALSAGGGFNSAASGGSFAPVGSTFGGFASLPSSGSGFGGGFGAFSGGQGSAFSAFGSNSAAGAARPPSELFTQMRK